MSLLNDGQDLIRSAIFAYSHNYHAELRGSNGHKVLGLLALVTASQHSVSQSRGLYLIALIEPIFDFGNQAFWARIRIYQDFC